MKAVLSILIVLVLGIGGFKIWEHWNVVKEQKLLDEKVAKGADIDPETLPGLPYQLQQRWIEARRGGPAEIKNFIQIAKRHPDMKDPRLAWIELDYVVAVTSIDPIEAKKVFREVKKRVPPESPVYPRIKVLEKAYE